MISISKSVNLAKSFKLLLRAQIAEIQKPKNESNFGKIVEMQA